MLAQTGRRTMSTVVNFNTYFVLAISDAIFPQLAPQSPSPCPLVLSIILQSSTYDVIFNQFFELSSSAMQSIVSSKDRLHFFEYMQIDVLQEYFRTGIHYFINAILNGYPQLIKFRYYSLEIATAIDFLKDFFFLITKNTTYAENFFDFQRKNGRSKLFALKSAIVWTIIPYVITKIENYYNQTVGEEIDGKKLGTIRKLFKVIFPYLYTIGSVVQTLYKFRYLYSSGQKEHYYNLLYHINGAQLGHSETSESSKYPILELLKKPGILIVLMGHKIITWYFANKNAKQTKIKQEGVLQVPAPIDDSQVDEQGKCPICTKTIKNATMVRTSGYVYCFDCINQYVRKESRCPMSRIPITVESLQVLYN